MKKFSTIVILVAIVAGGMYFTNPDKKDFRVWSEKKMQERLTENSDGGLGDVLGGILSTLGSQFSSAITQRANYQLCSVFTVDMGGDVYRYLGVFGQFIPLQFDQPFE
jgi:hypothetical protein